MQSNQGQITYNKKNHDLVVKSLLYQVIAKNIVNRIFIIAQWLYEKLLQLILLQVLNFKYEFGFLKKTELWLKIIYVGWSYFLKLYSWKQYFKLHFFIFQQTFPKCHLSDAKYQKTNSLYCLTREEIYA